MKVKGADEAKVHIAKRRAFRWNGFRGHKSKRVEGVYGVFYRKGVQGQHYRVMLLCAVFEPRTAVWYTTEAYAADIRAGRTDLPEDATKIRWVNAAWLLQDVYNRGYPALVEARLDGRL